MVKDKEKDIPSAMQRLEEIVEELSRGDLDVETSLTRFREGAALVKTCKSALDKAENEFIKIKKELELDEEHADEDEEETG